MGPKIWIYGFNPFDLDSDGNLKEVDLTTYLGNLDEHQNFRIEFTSTHALIASGSELFSHSCIAEKTHKINCDSRIVQLAANNWYCLVLLENGTLFKYDIDRNQTSPIDFLSVENAPDSEDSREKITHIVCGDKVSVAVTSGKSVFNIPNKTFTFPRHVRIRKISAGLEHCLLLTGNGDLYSWGCGLRGQLGNGEITPHQEEPKLIEALAGVKIIDIDAGGWHSAAVSSFGDLYTWGWNSKGQLGLVDEQQVRGSVFAVPQLVDFDGGLAEAQEEVFLERVHCGSGHTIAVSSGGTLYFAGNDLRQKLDYSRVERNPKLSGFRRFDSVPKVSGEALLIGGTNSIAFVERGGEVDSAGRIE